MRIKKHSVPVCALVAFFAWGCAGGGGTLDPDGDAVQPDIAVGDTAGDVVGTSDLVADSVHDAVADSGLPDIAQDYVEGDIDLDVAMDVALDLAIPDFGEAGFVPDDDCPVECPDGTGCSDGRCVAGTLVLRQDGSGGVSGVFLTPDGVSVGFISVTDGRGLARARFDLSAFDAIELGVTVTAVVPGEPGGLQVAGISWSDEMGVHLITGDGALNESDLQALGRLAAGPVSKALAQVPMEVGCLPADSVDPLVVQALLTPWQFMAKYVYPDRVSRAISAASKASCIYPALQDSTWTSGSTAIRFSREAPVPHVYGLLPLDAAASAELDLVAVMPAPGNEYGPCGATCRGACGADCNEISCVVTATGYACLKDENTLFNNGMRQETQEISCGTAQGCRDHDDCYDLCNGQLGCGSWPAASCRRDCDIEACWLHGYETCTHWAQGAGPQDSDLLTYIYPEPGSPPYEDQVNCTDPDHMTGTCWFKMQGLCGGNVCTSLDHCASLMKKDCSAQSLGQFFNLKEPYDQFVVNYFSAGANCPDHCTPECVPPE